MNNIKNLEDIIIKSSLRYYNGQDLLLTDEQFDSKVEELRNLNPDSWVLKTPNWGAIEDGVKIKHIGKNPVGSLNKIKYPEIIKHQDGFYASLKMDGLSVVVTSHNGNITAATRNDGNVGKICTDKIIKILESNSPGALEFLKTFEGTISIRGEIITDPRSVQGLHEKFRSEGKVFSPRNYAAGVMNRIEINEELNNLAFYTYYIRINTREKFNHYSQMIDYLTNNGFYIVPFTFEKEIIPDSLYSVYTMFKDRYDIDGLVLRDGITIEDESDYTEYEMKAVAYKFPSDRVNVEVGDVQWSTGSTGRVNPVCKLKTPVELSGAMIQNATAFHAKFVEDNKLGPGAVIEITRSGEVIPYITAVINGGDLNLPTKCNSCDTELVRDGVYLSCPNHDCPARVSSTIYRLLDVAGMPKGLSSKTIDDWLLKFPVDLGYEQVNSMTQFTSYYTSAMMEFDNRESLLKDSFGDHFGKLLYSLERNVLALLRKGLSFEQFWFVSGFNGLSNATAKKLEEVDPNDVIVGNIEKFSSIAPSNVRDSVLSEEGKSRLLTNLRIFKVIKVEVEKKQEVKLVISVTGSVKVPRGEWSKIMSSHGIEVGSVTKKTKYLVSNEPSTSSKSVAAREKGVEVVTEEEFYNILSRDYNITVTF